MPVRAIRDFADGDVDFILLAHELVPFGAALPRVLPLRGGLRLLRLRLRYSRLRLITVRAVEIVADTADDEQEEADDEEDAAANQEARLA